MQQTERAALQEVRDASRREVVLFMSKSKTGRQLLRKIVHLLQKKSLPSSSTLSLFDFNCEELIDMEDVDAALRALGILVGREVLRQHLLQRFTDVSSAVPNERGCPGQLSGAFCRSDKEKESCHVQGSSSPEHCNCLWQRTAAHSTAEIAR